jgi:hypothetical protein
MTVVTLRLFFYGLIAFTPDQFKCDGDMRALLLDARQPPVASDGCPIHSHAPALFYFVTQPGACELPCRNDRGLCRCDLDGGKLLDIGRTEHDLCYEKAKVQTAAEDCENSQASKGFGYLLRLSPLRFLHSRMKLHDDCNKACPVSDGYGHSEDPMICKLVAAQVNFHSHDFSICRMAGQPENGAHTCPKFNLRPLASQNLSNLSFLLPPQQVAEIVHFEARVQADPKWPQSITLTLASFDGGGRDTITIPAVKQGDEYYADLVIANFMEELDHSRTYSRCDQNFVARDFELFHDLVKRPMYPQDRTIPQTNERAQQLQIDPDIPNFGYDCDSTILNVFRRDILRAGDSRPICPQAVVAQ